MWAVINSITQNIDGKEYVQIIGIEPRNGKLSEFVHPIMHDRYIEITPEDNIEEGDRLCLTDHTFIKPTPRAILDEKDDVIDVIKLFNDEVNIVEDKLVDIPIFNKSLIGKHYTFENKTFNEKIEEQKDDMAAVLAELNALKSEVNSLKSITQNIKVRLDKITIQIKEK